MIRIFSRVRIALAAAAAVLALCVSLSTPTRTEAASISLTQVGSGFSDPLGITGAGDGTNRLFIVEQSGQIRILGGGGTPLATPFLDVSSVIVAGGERGLLGLAFHPSYETNGLFYIYYTASGSGDLTIARYSVSGDPNVANPAGTVILTIPHPTYANHNGGSLSFGPDGYLYIGTGDGGGGGDPSNNAQNLNSLLGKVLRIDIDSGPAYGIPPTNPLVGVAGLDEIWAYGLRNPWRITFDRLTGDLFIGDVGQNALEEVDFQAAGTSAIQNYGWRIMEGTACYNPPSGCSTAGLVQPILEYTHSFGCSITGGYRYRGAAPALYGTYLYGDYCSGRIWGATFSGTWSTVELLDTSLLIASFGESDAGEVYIADQSLGRIYRIEAVDGDGDGVTDALDNCPATPNAMQENADANLIDLSPQKSYDDTTLANSDTAGDACDTDDDNDGLSDTAEGDGSGCWGGQLTNPLVRDSDGDLVLDRAECVLVTDPNVVGPPSPFCAGAGDADADGVPDVREGCYYNTSSASVNTDGDACNDGREIASINASNGVDVIDLQQIATLFGAYTVPAPAVMSDFDLTKNRSIDVIDLQQAAAQFGSCP